MVKRNDAASLRSSFSCLTLPIFTSHPLSYVPHPVRMVASVSAIPVLLLGEAIQRRCSVLERYNIPVPVVGGLTVCLLILFCDLSGLCRIFLLGKVNSAWWT